MRNQNSEFIVLRLIDYCLVKSPDQFQTLRTMIERDPGMLQSVLQELGQANPELLQVLMEI